MTVDPAAKQQIGEKAYTLAYEYEQKYGSCPQCVLAALQEAAGTGDDQVFKAGHVLAGGGALSTAGTCGALAGGMLAIGVKYGRAREDFATGRSTAAAKLAKELLDRFVAEFGSPICADVQTKLMGRSFNMWDQKDYKAFEEAGGHRDKCPSVAARAAKWTAEILLEAEEKAQQRSARSS